MPHVHFVIQMETFYPSMGDFVMGNAAFSFNYDDNKDTAMQNSRLKILQKMCHLCNAG